MIGLARPPPPPLPPLGLGWTLAARDAWQRGSPPTGWRSNEGLKVTTCGELGSMLGGYKAFGKEAYVEKTFDLSDAPPHNLIEVQLDFIKIDNWDGEKAFVWIDGQKAWEQRFYGAYGETHCEHGLHQGKAAVRAVRASSAWSVTVKVNTTLDEAAWDEAWAIQNVVVSVATRPPPPPVEEGLWPALSSAAGAMSVTAVAAVIVLGLACCYGKRFFRLMKRGGPPSTSSGASPATDAEHAGKSMKADTPAVSAVEDMYELNDAAKAAKAGGA